MRECGLAEQHRGKAAMGRGHDAGIGVIGRRDGGKAIAFQLARDLGQAPSGGTGGTELAVHDQDREIEVLDHRSLALFCMSGCVAGLRAVSPEAATGGKGQSAGAAWQATGQTPVYRAFCRGS
jgi:hypothetical protein